MQRLQCLFTLTLLLIFLQIKWLNGESFFLSHFLVGEDWLAMEFNNGLLCRSSICKVNTCETNWNSIVFSWEIDAVNFAIFFKEFLEHFCRVV
ncbi:hypothetical protein ECANGB1_2625 [Enterospora canceri]|uniref:Uncharacterized protein n=1 Tax=Enterospora canceri TaxID=1081671 RepID=A0A1Y1SAN2_9MICR|nr:hypothetical protein ECANGB1_2625 [Enterospora canceri]